MEASHFVVEGRIAVEALIDSGRFKIDEVVVEENRHADLVDRAESRGLSVQIVDTEAIHQEAGYAFHRGVLARAQRPRLDQIDEAQATHWKRVVFPYGIADPGNLGTIIRSAAALGIDAVMLPKDIGADVWNRKAIRASATAVFRISLVEIEDPIEGLRMMREWGFVSFGTSLSPRAQPLEAVEPAQRSLMMLGAEKDGLGKSLEAACDELITIPMSDGMDSLNVAATAAIVYYHFAK